MDDWEEYKKRKQEYLMNRKPERYKVINMGYGFVIVDTVKAKYDDGKYEYHYFPDYPGKTEEEDNPRFYNLKDLVDELNYLDFQVNGNLYDDYYHILSNKERFHDALCNWVDNALDNLVANDKFTINMSDFTVPSPENIKIDVQIYREGLKNIGRESPILDTLIINTLWSTINDYESELEKEDKIYNSVAVDTLIELKMRLMERLHNNNLIWK